MKDQIFLSKKSKNIMPSKPVSYRINDINKRNILKIEDPLFEMKCSFGTNCFRKKSYNTVNTNGGNAKNIKKRKCSCGK